MGAVSFGVEVLLSARPARSVSVNFIALGLLAWILVPLITLLQQ